MTIMTSAVGKAKQRSRTGCRTCRSRKVKCDERAGGCGNCARLNLLCSDLNGDSVKGASVHNGALPSSTGGAAVSHDFALGLDLADSTQAGLKRSRTYRSCRRCRESKTRCSGERPSCRRCSQRGEGCVYDGRLAPVWVEATAGGKGGSLSVANVQTTKAEAGAGDDQTKTEPSSGDQNSGPDSGLFTSEDFAWLMTDALPAKDKMPVLAEEYFAGIHSLRCYAFIHKPTFMRDLGRQSAEVQQGHTLLHVICALGAKLYVLRHMKEMSPPPDLALRAGNQWANKARNLVMNSQGVSYRDLMTLILLHDHDLRTGNYSGAFMLTGMAVRMAQALQLQLEPRYDPVQFVGRAPESCREIRRRLMWSVYAMDVAVGSGDDKLTMIDEDDIDLRTELPCDETNFIMGIPTIVETMRIGQYAPFLSQESLAKGPIGTLDLQAHSLRLLSLRKRVLRFVKHLDVAQDPWLPDSEYATLRSSIAAWYEALPTELHFNPTAVPPQQESPRRLGAVAAMHIVYHQTLTDLTRISLPAPARSPYPAFRFPAEQDEFVRRTQEMCLEHASGVSLVLKGLLQEQEQERGGPYLFVDAWMPIAAYDSTRIIVQILTRGLANSARRASLYRPHALACLRVNIRALEAMLPVFQLARPLYESVASVLASQADIDLRGLTEVFSARQESLSSEREQREGGDVDPFSFPSALDSLQAYLPMQIPDFNGTVD